MTPSHFYVSLDDYLSNLDREMGDAQLLLEKYREAFQTGRFSEGLSHRRIPQKAAEVGMADAKARIAVIDKVRRDLKNLDARAAYEEQGERFPDWTCPKCGTDLPAAEVISGGRYCEHKGDGLCPNLAAFIVAVQAGQESNKYKVCIEHLPVFVARLAPSEVSVTSIASEQI